MKQCATVSTSLRVEEWCNAVLRHAMWTQIYEVELASVNTASCCCDNVRRKYDGLECTQRYSRFHVIELERSTQPLLSRGSCA